VPSVFSQSALRRGPALWLLSIALVACAEDDPTLFSAQPAEVDTLALSEPLRPLPPPPDLDAGRVALGRELFHEPRLSGDGETSCASCHALAAGGADARRFSVRSGGADAPVNTPTVLNAALHFRWSWDGRAGSLAEQVEIAGHEELGLRPAEMAERVAAVPSYAASFREVYGEAGPDQVVDALVTFQRSLLTPSRFDRYLVGERDALTEAEREGYALFKRLGCAACHQGTAVGGNMFQRFGVLGDYFGDRGDPTEADLGRFNVTGREDDRHVFKVPGLRNVALTAPYFHDGSTESLEDAVRIMARYQLGRELQDDEVSRIAAFLGSLSGERQPGGPS
jgi:cytochrome c peroxidase